MIIEPTETTLRKCRNVTLTACFTEEVSFHTKDSVVRTNKVVRTLTGFRLDGPSGTVEMDADHFGLDRLNAHASGFFEHNGESFKALTEVPKSKTTRFHKV